MNTASWATQSVKLVLRRVAPPELTRWTTFDVDGDGDAELLVWGTGAVGHGALMIHHFAAGPRLVRTEGPLLGVAGPTLEVAPGVDEDGRFLALRDGQGRCGRRPFDDRGRLLPICGEVAWPSSESVSGVSAGPRLSPPTTSAVFSTASS